MKTEHELREFCKGNYYCTGDVDDDGDYLWEPFEGYAPELIEEYIDNDVRALKNFLGYPKEWRNWDEESNEDSD